MKNNNKMVNSRGKVFTTLGASNHSKEERQCDDFYATDPKAGELLLTLENFSNKIWECACGMGHLSEVFKHSGYDVLSTDLINRGYGKSGVDFLTIKDFEWDGDIITNPPYRYAKAFIEKSLEIIPEGNKVAMFLKVQFMEGIARKTLFTNHPPKTIYVSSSRLQCAKDAEFERMKAGGGSAIAFAWFIWEKGYSGSTQVKWFN